MSTAEGIHKSCLRDTSRVETYVVELDMNRLKKHHITSQKAIDCGRPTRIIRKI